MRNGFTLVELAIVIVIIGLLVGGVLQGQELINQAKISSAISKIQGYNAAVNTFKSKYSAIPGDIINPGPLGLNSAKGDSTINTCYTTMGGSVSVTSGNAGDGNGILGVMTGANCTATSGGAFTYSINNNNAPSGEVTNFFVHLANGQFVKESFTQAIAPLAGWPWSNPDVGTAYPAMSVGVGMAILSDGGLNYWVLGTSKQIQRIGNVAGNNLSAFEAYSIDTKLDDGNPASGNTQAVSNYGNVSALTFTLASAGASNCVFTGGSAYNISGAYSDNKLCTIRVQTGF